ncbi:MULTISPECIES: calcium:proton antiporter [unclassified Agrobacterium]|uniref:calcium:proton antiporter n=1 Tax=unclassified Agrobacterium TaxID=2632611 RepID=UPI00244AE8F2|nr:MULTISPECIES: calcium:proton antiporter [unclassified Agrobacterium]MDH0613946.1 calcium:proton antiporter [Agrobacterium sp. GD03872]MDH0696835.1 calcium:proton antiporter [Agrobacterium sp. GD03871]MDH1060001.1 calcium:proton antiporter [Agrobacterium sp. GD03992]MDH2209914.1 calcium:proton antiporter [Agrobacterium sp. GD03643]MDH2219413.1 calcium:proton antiporter [Agrobacterium sp. GD03638]
MAGSILKQERMLLLAIPAAILAYMAEHAIFEAGKTAALIAAIMLIGLIVLVSMRVAHHAEILAAKVGDPYGTMILTLSAVAVEVLILAIIMSESSSPTLVRDTIYSAVMIDINGILGLAALLGGLRHGEQPYNDDSGKTYGVMILTAMGISMIVPEFIPQQSWHVYSAFTIVAMIALYALFLKMQVGPHSYFFSYTYPRKTHPAGQAPDSHADEEDEGSVPLSIGLIIAGVVLIGVLAEFMSAFLSESLEGTSAPPALMAVVVATISASPEILTALRSALRNRMQAVVNIAMGASLSTVILTVPVMEGIALYTGQPFIMAMTPVQTVMVFITLIAAAINLNDGETNAIEGMTHFILFATFIMLLFLGL